ncbi:hypothetical protein HGRIS_008764 [Hohenbuehelia grisea]|uniref:PUM-HD domain-containing protein n=1 Tax=Hohenbuehelia grisea TaxID=104357 RepID=A0ABR3J980_9AGAR
MQSTDKNQQYLALYDNNPPRNRQLSGIAASIWAPQPLPSESTWPRTMDSLTRVVDGDPQQNVNVDNQLPVTREDVFGSSDKKQVGAIGDGRKKNSPNIDDTHVEQLLRTLNLNSPAPYVERPTLNLSFDNSTSPDFSPASVASGLITPTDLSPARASFDNKLHPPYEFTQAIPYLSQPSLLFEPTTPTRPLENLAPSHSPVYRATHLPASFASPANSYPYFEHFPDHSPRTSITQSLYNTPPRRPDAGRIQMEWRPAHQQLQQLQQITAPAEWLRPAQRSVQEMPSLAPPMDEPLRSAPVYQSSSGSPNNANEPINFLSLLHPSSSPPYPVFVNRIIKSSDQQASIFLQQKLKVADVEERAKIVDAICSRGYEMMAHRFGNWAVQRCLEAASAPEERRKIVTCMRGRVVELATNCYGCHVLQKALDCEEDIRLLIVSELLLHDPASTLVNKHASHVWSKIMELTWTPPVPPIFAYVNKSLQGKWAALACHETGSLVVQHAFENLEESAKDGIVDELLNQGAAVFGEVAKNQWGSYCIQHILEHGSDKHRLMTLDHLLNGLLEYATNEQGAKSVTKALKEGGKDTLDRVVQRMCEPAKGARRAMIVDLALSVTGSQLIASVLPSADKDQRANLYDCIRGHIVTLRGCKTGSKVIWLFDRMVR